MKYYSLIILFFLLPALTVSGQNTAQRHNITIAIHGGAGNITAENMTPQKEKAYHAALNKALEAGYAVLKNGGSSMDAVKAAIQYMEESPLFNAGKGAVFTNERKNELDASVMDGKDLRAGAVAGVSRIKSPVEAAIAVMQQSPHVLMAGKGAEQFAEEKGLEMVDPSYFYTKERMEELDRVLQDKTTESEIKKSPKSGIRTDNSLIFTNEGEKFGTVGCVALDADGNLAAGTSTGGMTNKRFGRIGDSPIIGAGTYANNTTCAVSATGHGEYFIRSVVAYDISALMEYKGLSIHEAADEVVMRKLPQKGGAGGVIALDAQGNIAMPFNTQGMYRGYIKGNGERETLIYK